MFVAWRKRGLIRVGLLEKEVYIHRDGLDSRTPSVLTDHQRC